ncbi:DUF2997 domain-containing protein [Paenibacillus peoriae]|uniref:DUF2997 domain-containing protein n=1 Tax=Paenibacillus peoriae TaxID=59893 RepID=A0A7H0Y251_9BACL|nr:DUF2997 domain-containing protein [Paenibacillus peoriae]QNR65159.1 DUF2997 domain-containing protein [Paenibacillus peoriae]
MADQRIEVTCHKDGTFTIEAFDFQGTNCDQATKDFERVLGAEGLNKIRKPEFLAINMLSQQQINRVHGG